MDWFQNGSGYKLELGQVYFNLLKHFKDLE